MAENEQAGREHAAEVTQRNVEQARDLLAARKREQQARGAEPPLEDDAAAENQPRQGLQDQDNVPAYGGTYGQLNTGGGRSYPAGSN